jgi:hypothetical protein
MRITLGVILCVTEVTPARTSSLVSIAVTSHYIVSLPRE